MPTNARTEHARQAQRAWGRAASERSLFALQIAKDPEMKRRYEAWRKRIRADEGAIARWAKQIGAVVPWSD